MEHTRISYASSEYQKQNQSSSCSNSCRVVSIIAAGISTMTAILYHSIEQTQSAIPKSTILLTGHTQSLILSEEHHSRRESSLWHAILFCLVIIVSIVVIVIFKIKESNLHSEQRRLRPHISPTKSLNVDIELQMRKEGADRGITESPDIKKIKEQMQRQHEGNNSDTIFKYKKKLTKGNSHTLKSNIQIPGLPTSR